MRRLLALVVILGLVAGAVVLRLGYDDWRTDRTQEGLQQELSLGPPPEPDAVSELLDALEPDTLSPKQALDALYALKRLKVPDT